MKHVTSKTLLIAALLASPASAQELIEVAQGLDQPVFVTNAADGSGRLFIVERPGRIRICHDGSVLPQPFLDISQRVRTDGEFGMLGLAFHPDFENNRRFFVYYSPTLGTPRMVVAEFQASAQDPNVASDAESVVISVPEPFSNHNGGTIAFGPDGFLYAALGDGGGGGDPQNNGQNLQTLLGAMLRLNVDDGPLIPPDNPFVGLPGRDEIWAYGLRNPFRFSFDRATGRLFLGDVGQNSFEEVDIIERGGNYGWRIMEGNSCFNPPAGCDLTGLTLPIHSYGRSDGSTVTGGVVYRGLLFPELQGAYLFADFGSGSIWALREDSPGIWTRTTLFENVGGIVAFGEDELAEVYLVNLFTGRLLALGTSAQIDDLDRDGVPDAVEDAAPNEGDANRDGIPDRAQPHVASLHNLSGHPVTLMTSAGLQLADVRFVENPSLQDSPTGVEFPFGFAAFEVRGLPVGGQASLTMLLFSSTPLNSYFRFGPTPEAPQPHWYPFLPDGTGGAEVGTHSVTLHLADGLRGDDDLTADGVIVDAGGPAFDPGGMRVSYFPQVGDGTDGSLFFQTGTNFVNTGPDTVLTLDFFQSDGSPMELDFNELGRTSSMERTLPAGQSFTAISSGAGDENGHIQVGYARISTAAGVGGTLVFQRTDAPSGIRIFETGIPAAETLQDFTILVDSLGEHDTGLALVNPPEAMPPIVSPATRATVILRLYDADFNLLAEATETLEDGEHLARYPGEFFADMMPEGLEEMQGSITVESDLPLAAVTLRQTDRIGIDFPDEVPTLTAFPVVPGRADVQSAPAGVQRKGSRSPGKEKRLF